MFSNTLFKKGRHTLCFKLESFVQIEEVDLSLSDDWNMKLGVKIINDGGNKNNLSKNSKN